MKILDRWGKTLWDDDKPTVKESLEAAYLARAYLVGAYLARANLADAYLVGANLADANLADANLVGANLADANLADANLVGANLADANLADANLARAYLADANLARANLVPELVTPLLCLLDAPGALAAYKVVNEQGEGVYNGGIVYEIGEAVEVEDANTDPSIQCAAGINVATLDWCLREWRPGRKILVVNFEASDIAAIPTATDGKFRLHRCKVVGEKEVPEQIRNWYGKGKE